MPLLDIFKKKKKPEGKPKKETKKEEKPKEIKEEKPSPGAGLETKPRKIKKTAIDFRILQSPHVTEKATDLAERNQYVFKVLPKANKVQIKNAVEGIYGVDVISVKIINIGPKKRKLGRTEGYLPGYKKAIVKIKEGQKIEIMPR